MGINGTKRVVVNLFSVIYLSACLFKTSDE